MPNFFLHSFATAPQTHVCLEIRTEKLDVDFVNCETLFIRIWNCKWSLLSLAFYRPPSAHPLTFLEELRNKLQTFRWMNDNCLVGDFNIDTLKQVKSLVCDYLNLLAYLGLECLIIIPTREEHLGDHIVKSCLDHINVRAQHIATKSAIIEQKLADLYYVACQLVSQLTLRPPTAVTQNIEIINRARLDKLVQKYD